VHFYFGPFGVDWGVRLSTITVGAEEEERRKNNNNAVLLLHFLDISDG
jgi:hypothetical protein